MLDFTNALVKSLFSSHEAIVAVILNAVLGYPFPKDTGAAYSYNIPSRPAEVKIMNYKLANEVTNTTFYTPHVAIHFSSPVPISYACVMHGCTVIFNP